MVTTFLTPITPPCHQEGLFSHTSPAGFPAIAMKSAIICEQWKFEYSAPPSPRGRVLPTTLGRVKTSLGQSQPCPEAEPQPAPGLEPRCPAGLIGLTDHRSADRYPHHGRQSRAPFHCCTVHPLTIVLEFRLHEVILHTSNSAKELFFLHFPKFGGSLVKITGSCSFPVGNACSHLSAAGSDYHRII